MSPDLSRLSNLIGHCADTWCWMYLGFYLQDLSFWHLLGTSACTTRTCLESQQGPTINWECKCTPFQPPKWVSVIFHYLSEHKHSGVEKHLFATQRSNRYSWANRNFLCEEKYLKQCTAASSGEELEKDTWLLKWNWFYSVWVIRGTFTTPLVVSYTTKGLIQSNQMPKKGETTKISISLIKSGWGKKKKPISKACSFTDITYINCIT